MSSSDARAHDTSAPGGPAWTVVGEGGSVRPARIGPYEITGELGRGGMGVVYHARDSRLGRSVAIKAVSDSFVDDPERLARFEREGRLLGALDHPNVAGIHGIEEVGGQRYLVLQYVDGETLAQRLARGPMALEEAFDVCRQIALALETAHDNGVVHRDLKPANVKIKPDGQVKVLDFGLAKEVLKSTSGHPAESPTIAATMTGTIVGTAAYMSPEQARGRAVDRRADIWAFGCVFYECLVGRQVFGGESVTDSLAAILEREPDWSALPAAVPQRARELLRRLLVKDPRRRIRDMGDVRLELEDFVERPAGASGERLAAVDPRGAAGAGSRRIAVVAACAAIVVCGTLGLVTAARHGSSSRVTRLSMMIPADVRGGGAWLTRDGRRVLVGGKPLGGPAGEEPLARLYTRDLSRFELQPVAGTEGIASAPWPTRDGRSVLFVGPAAAGSNQRRLLSVPLDKGSPPTAIADWRGDWSGLVELADGEVVTIGGMGTTLVRLPAHGGKPVRTKIAAGGYRGTFELPNRPSLVGDHHVLANAISYGPRGWVIGLALLDCRDASARILVEDGGNGTLLPGDVLAFTRGDALLAARFDRTRMRLIGDPVSVTSGLRTHGVFLPADYTVANGTMLYAPGGRVGEQRQLVALTPDGRTRPVTTDRKIFTGAIGISTADRIAVCATGPRGLDEIWLYDPGQSAMRLAVSIPGDCSNPVWSPNGRELAFMRSANDSTNGVYVVDVDSGRHPRRLLGWGPHDAAVMPTSWSPDGATLLATRYGDDGRDVVMLPIGADGIAGSLRELVATPAQEFAPTLSRDGRWLAYTSDATGRDAIYVRSFGAGGVLGPAFQVTSGRAMYPRWTADQRLVYYDELLDRGMVAPLRLGATISAGEATTFVDNTASRILGFNVRGDGTAYGIQASEAEVGTSRYDVVLNGVGEVQRALSRR